MPTQDVRIVRLRPRFPVRSHRQRELLRRPPLPDAVVAAGGGWRGRRSPTWPLSAALPGASPWQRRIPEPPRRRHAGVGEPAGEWPWCGFQRSRSNRGDVQKPCGLLPKNQKGRQTRDEKAPSRSFTARMASVAVHSQLLTTAQTRHQSCENRSRIDAFPGSSRETTTVPYLRQGMPKLRVRQLREPTTEFPPPRGTTNAVNSSAARKLRKRGGGQQNPSISP